MESFEVLCVTMHQNNFSKIKEMNIKSNVVFANQADHTSYEETEFDGYKAKMISTETRGVGINRNIAFMYASADICLMADDDVVYYDDYQSIIVKEFALHPDADIFVFHLDTDYEKRKQKAYTKTRKCRKIERMPWGGCRIAFRLNSLKKANVWFTMLFGGGSVFSAGEDSKWLLDSKKARLTFYVSKETIGKVFFEESSWFTGANEKFYYGKGAFYQAVHPKAKYIWMLYFALRTYDSELSFKEKIRWMKNGVKGYYNLESYK